MRRRSSTLLLAATLFLPACDRDAATNLTSAAPPSLRQIGTGATTTQPPQAYPLVPSAQVTPLLTVGDPLPNGGAWAPIPDGLGGYRDGDDYVLFANHELTATGVRDNNNVQQYKFARVSRLVLDASTLAVKDASYVVTGSEQYLRLCSATFVGPAQGFPSGYFLTGEESVGGVHDGIQLAVGRNGGIHELPWLGRYAHENQISVPGFPGKVVLVGTDDSRGASELYLYVAGSEADVLSGSGALYVFASTEAGGAAGFLTEGQSITGHFVRVSNPASLSSAGLQTAVDALGAFRFVRLEDVDYDPQTTGSQSPAIYFVDTGSEGVKCGAADCDPMGSIYRMDLNAGDPTQGGTLTLLQRSRGAPVEFASPDNIAVGKNSIMVQEDPAYSGFVRAPRIWQFHTDANRQFTDRGTAVVELPNANCSDSAGTCWESSGIIDASADLGAGVWLFDIQAHTLAVPTIGLRNEGGQLLALRLPGS